MAKRIVKDPHVRGKVSKAQAKRAIKLAARVALPVRIRAASVSLLDVAPPKEGVWVKNTAIIFSEDDKIGYIHKPYFDQLVKEAYPKEGK